MTPNGSNYLDNRQVQKHLTCCLEHSLEKLSVDREIHHLSLWSHSPYRCSTADNNAEVANKQSYTLWIQHNRVSPMHKCWQSSTWTVRKVLKCATILLGVRGNHLPLSDH